VSWSVHFSGLVVETDYSGQTHNEMLTCQIIPSPFSSDAGGFMRNSPFQQSCTVFLHGFPTFVDCIISSFYSYRYSFHCCLSHTVLPITASSIYILLYETHNSASYAPSHRVDEVELSSSHPMHAPFFHRRPNFFFFSKPTVLTVYVQHLLFAALLLNVLNVSSFQFPLFHLLIPLLDYFSIFQILSKFN
jgi:hypothetical protein